LLDDEWIIIRHRRRDRLSEDNKGELHASINALVAPVENGLGRIQSEIGTVLSITLPVDQRASASDRDDMFNDLARVTVERGALEIDVIAEGIKEWMRSGGVFGQH